MRCFPLTCPTWRIDCEEALSGRRIRRVNEILREVIADECQNLKDPRIGFLTVTGVSVSPDLRRAKVYFTVLGGDEADAEAAEGLAASASRIRAAVGRQVRMKYIPRLEFVGDPVPAEARRIEALLRGERTGGSG